MKNIKSLFAKIFKKVDKIVRSDKEVVDNFLSDKKVEQNLLNMANYFQSRYGKGWISVNYVEKTQDLLKSKKEIAEILTLLSLKGYAISETKDGKQRFKILLDKKEQIAYYENVLSEIDFERTKVCSKIRELKKRPS